MSTKTINITSNGDIEKIIESIALNETELSGKGYINTKENIVGIMIFPTEKPTEMIDIFFKLDK